MPKQVWKPATLLTPTPAALVTCGTMEHPNVLTVAWTGIVCSTPAMTYVSVRPERFSHHLIEESGEFVINVTTAELVRAADFCGCRSGADTDKFAEAGLTPVPASQVAPPLIEESPVSLECRVVEVKRLGSHDLFLAEIVAVDVDDACVDADGKLNLRKSGIAFYSHGEYFGQGKKLGQMGFSVRKKRSKNPKQGPAERPIKPENAPGLEKAQGPAKSQGPKKAQGSAKSRNPAKAHSPAKPRGEEKNSFPTEFRGGKPVFKKREKRK
ncbi:MAG: flavin reductase family protein [Oscillospiraceae bacterium]|mgnify:CR=1 FL=1|nr:flavin reductase family protein [Oscillospiraceae bacterium]